MDGIRAPRLSRRELLTGGLAGVGLGVLADADPAAAAAPVSDGTLLSYALEIEHLSVFAYEHALSLPDAIGASRALLLEFVDHERNHVAILSVGVLAVGGSPPAPVQTVARANAVLSQHGLSTDIGSVRKLEDAIKLLLDIEGLNQGAYYAAIDLMSASGPLLSAVEALGCEAQHQTLLTDLLYPDKVKRSVPGAFVQGWQ